MIHPPTCFFIPLLSAVLAGSAFTQESNAIFDAAVPQLTGFEPPFRRLLDINRDGFVDAVGLKVAKKGRAFTTAVYLNDGRGVFTEHYEAYVDVGETGKGLPNEILIESGDLDGDGDGDWVVSGRGTLYIFKTQGVLPSFTRPEIQVSGNVRALTVADVNGDGIDEIVVATGTLIEILRSDGTVESFAHGLNPLGATTLRTLDADSDTCTDLLVATAGALHLFHQVAPGTFSAATTFPHACVKAMVDVGDVDGDGDTDIVVFDGDTMTSYQVLRRVAGGGWNLESKTTGGPGEFLRDVDGDGDLDGVCCGGGPCYTCPEWENNIHPTDFQISLNDGTGRFAPAFQIHGLGSPQLAGVADLDGDGDADLIAGRVVYYARGPIGPPKTQGAAALPFVPRPRDLGDFDGDGDPDIGLSLERVFVNDGDGAFEETALNVAPPPGRTRFRGPGYPGDFDGDGDIDLLVEQLATGARGIASPVLGFGANRAPGLLGMRLLKNDGTGSFIDGGAASAAGVTFSQGSLTSDASMAVDLNADGRLDLVTRSMSFPAVSTLWLNRGSGAFVGPWTLDGYRVELVQDLDRDGIVDLITSDPWTGTGLREPYQKLELFKGYPLGNGLAHWIMIPGLVEGGLIQPLENPLAFGDFYGAGYVDVVALGFFGTPHVLWDRQAIGGMGFGAQSSLASGRSMRDDAWVSVGDLDGNGMHDAVIGPYDGGGREIVPMVEVSLATSRWRFESILQLMDKGVLADVDLDGDLDMVGAQVTFNTDVR